MQVEENDVGRRLDGHLDRLRAVRDRNHLVATRRHQRFDHATNRVLILDDENVHVSDGITDEPAESTVFGHRRGLRPASRLCYSARPSARLAIVLLGAAFGPPAVVLFGAAFGPPAISRTGGEPR